MWGIWTTHGWVSRVTICFFCFGLIGVGLVEGFRFASRATEPTLEPKSKAPTISREQPAVASPFVTPSPASLPKRENTVTSPLPASEEGGSNKPTVTEARVLGTELVGINGTGVTARVHVSALFGVSGNVVRLFVQNTSKSGTITNIGVFVRSGVPTFATKMVNAEDLPEPGVTGPGSYRLVPGDLTVETGVFTAICSFSLMTSSVAGDVISKSFHDGAVSSGIPPGRATWFSLVGIGRESLTAAPFERGIIIRFQAIGDDERTDIAVFPRLDLLYPSLDRPASEQPFKIYKSR